MVQSLILIRDAGDACCADRHRRGALEGGLLDAGAHQVSWMHGVVFVQEGQHPAMLCIKRGDRVRRESRDCKLPQHLRLAHARRAGEQQGRGLLNDGLFATCA